jgi:hypothetical protein
MNANSVTAHYDRLMPEERFRLMMAAGARGDDAEQERLKATGGRITLSIQDHMPFANAFDELARLTFMELLDMSVGYLDALEGPSEIDELSERGVDGATDGADDAMAHPDDEVDSDRGMCLTGQRRLDIALATGYLLKVRTEGWKRFCERLGVPSFALWELLPGYKRLRIALRLADGTPDMPGAAFAPEGMIAWLNKVRPTGESEVRKLISTVDWYAERFEEMYRERATWWGG